MGTNSKISWTDHTVNFWTGCRKVSAGCKYCYMYRDQERYGKNPTDVLQVKQSTINKVLKNAKAGDKIFTCSWSDFFIEEADLWRDWAWGIIRDNPQFVWQILTKRPERILECLPKDWGEGWSHVWLGVSVENQQEANNRIPKLIAIPAKVRWLSMEPLLEEVSLRYICLKRPMERIIDVFAGASDKSPIDWIVLGGESGNDNGKYKYRPCYIDWFMLIIDQARYADVPIWFKQTGTYLSKTLCLKDRSGANIDELPPILQLQQLPK